MKNTSIEKPNIVLVYADDLGRGMLSCYGQQKFSTPNIDRLANEGMQFQNYCTNAFCAPARASLLCGIHDCHAGRWSYTPSGYYKKLSSNELTFEKLQEILQKSSMDAQCNGQFMASLLKDCGYHTGEIGKLEWGFSTTSAEMTEHGWDYHYGYYDHLRCHGYYPPFLFENGNRVDIPGNTDPHCGRGEYYTENDMPPYDMSYRQVYSQDLFDDKISDYINAHQHEPFFLFHPSQLPHGTIFYDKLKPEVANHPDLTEKEKQYASMVLRLDETVGKIYRQLQELNLLEKTIFLFTSDNGHTIGYKRKGRSTIAEQLDGQPTNNLNRPFRTSTCGDVFNGNDGMAGLKFTNWNGGVFCPLLVRYPQLVAPKSTCNALVAGYDLLPTFIDMAGGETPTQTDGISFLPMLLGSQVPLHDAVYFASNDGPAVVTAQGWKLRMYIDASLWQGANLAKLVLSDQMVYQLYDLNTDFEERNDLAEQHPALVQTLKHQLWKACDGNFHNGTPMAHLMQPMYPVPTWEENVQGKY